MVITRLAFKSVLYDLINSTPFLLSPYLSSYCPDFLVYLLHKRCISESIPWMYNWAYIFSFHRWVSEKGTFRYTPCWKRVSKLGIWKHFPSITVTSHLAEGVSNYQKFGCFQELFRANNIDSSISPITGPLWGTSHVFPHTTGPVMRKVFISYDFNIRM